MTHYHRYEKVSENSDGLVEICKDPSCRKRLVTKKDKFGRIDNRTYLREHTADFAQPTGSTKKVFEQVYGAPKKENANP